MPTRDGRQPHLVVPYALDTNDMRFATAQGFNSGDQFFAYLRDAFDVLYAEGDPRGLDAPKMLSIGLHARLAGRPGRTAALARFLDHVRRTSGVDRAADRHRAALDRDASRRGARQPVSHGALWLALPDAVQGLRDDERRLRNGL